jgi:hypothetical protein
MVDLMKAGLREVLLMDLIEDLTERVQQVYAPGEPMDPQLEELVRLLTAYLNGDMKTVGIYLGKHLYYRPFSN